MLLESSTYKEPQEKLCPARSFKPEGSWVLLTDVCVLSTLTPNLMTTWNNKLSSESNALIPPLPAALSNAKGLAITALWVKDQSGSAFWELIV